ncbi:MAG: N-formylglutamate amidohydrolase [Pseudomonadota bacterium]
MKEDFFIITCEHGGNRIPAEFRHFFRGHESLLDTHRGYDPGALTMARDLAQTLDAPLVSSVTSRLLIDLNRSIGHPDLYSEVIRVQDQATRRDILDRFYLPYRSRVEDVVETAVAAGRRVVHISSHSFAPLMNGELRNADVGLLYDPARDGELVLCKRWQEAIRGRMPEVRVRRNYPYTGKSDGFTSLLRRRFEAGAYVGIELEINQAIVGNGGGGWVNLRKAIIGALGGLR